MSSSSSSSGPAPNPQPPEIPIIEAPRCESSNSGSSGGCGCSNGNEVGTGLSHKPIRYFNGEIMLAADDMSAGGLGMSLGHRRVHSNQLASNYNYGNGYNWMVQQWGHLIDVQGNGDEIVAVLGAQHSCWFDYNSGTSSYDTRHGMLEELRTGTNVFEVCHSDGTVYTFHDFNQTNAGQLKKVTAPGGSELTLSYDADKRVSEVSREIAEGGTTTYESFLYTYIDDVNDDNDGLMESVLWRKKVGAGSWENIERCRYAYYDDGVDNGLKGDLECAFSESWDGSTWSTAQTTYYRYYKDALGDGYAHGLKLVLGPDAYSRATDPLNAEDSHLKTVADHYFEYDSAQCVTCEVADGGNQTMDFAYTSNNQADGYNNWKKKTVETLPDGNTKTVYTNYVGQVLLEELKSGSDTWVDFFKYDSDGRRIEHAMPSAVASYVDNAGAGSNELSVTLNSSSGLIYVTDYYSSTTATSSTAGGAIGRVQYEKVKQGSSGSAIKLREIKYFKRTANSFDTFPVASESVFRSDASGGSDAATTEYAYTFHSGVHQVDQRTTKLPAVPTSENGENVVDESYDVFDTNGQLIWNKGARGFIRQQVWDTVLGTVTQRIEDVDTTTTTDEPSGWTTPAGAGLHLTSDYEYDDHGRVTQSLGPVHEVDLGGVSAEDVRTANWTVYSDDGTEIRKSRGYRKGSGTSGAITLINPVTITKLDDAGRVVEQITADRATTNTLVTASESFALSTYQSWSTNQYDDEGKLTSSRVYHTIPTTSPGSSGTHYDQTDYGYDDMQRRHRQKTPGGTIHRTVFDVRGQVESEWIGTDDVPTSGEWSPTNNSGANMTKINEYEYDSDADGGDGNLTKLTAHVDGSTTRVTTFTYDWRNRRTKTTNPADNDARITYTKATLDNLDRVTKQETYHDKATDELLSQIETKYDIRGRVYQTIRHEVNSGTVGQSLTDNAWYDCCGNIVKQQHAGSDQFTKFSYDGVGRQTDQYIGYDTDETSYADALTLTDDTILEQTQTTYDEGGNVIQVDALSRYHDDTSATGALVAGTSARPAYTAQYPDGVGRIVATAEYGNLGGDSTAFTRAGEIPARSDTVLVSETGYNDAGLAFKTTDPAGVETRTEYDAAGRVTKTITNYTDGDPTTGNEDEDVTVERTYNADGALATLVAKQASSVDDQTTTYVYGVEGVTSPAVTRNDLLRAEIYPDSDDVASPLGDGTDSTYDRVEYEYNRQGKITQKKDQNGTVHQLTYDKLGRQLIDKATTLGSGVDTVVRRIETSYNVRGQVENVTSYDATTSGSVTSDIEYEYNGFNQITKEYQNHSGAVNTSTSPKVQYAFASGSDNTIRPTSVTYPDGRVVNYSYGSGMNDALSRIEKLQVGATDVVEYEYLGLGQVASQKYVEPTTDVEWLLDHGTSHAYAALDRFGRMEDLQWKQSSTQHVHLKHGYDRAGNRLWREDKAASTSSVHLDELYSYDGVHRLKTVDRGDLNGTHTTISSKNFAQDWSLDMLGNWDTFKDDADGNGWDFTQTRTHNEANELGTISNWANPVHDLAGNMTTIPQPSALSSSYTLKFDAWNRMVEVKDGASFVQSNEYDGLNRRIVKIDKAADPDVTHDYYYSNRWQVLEIHEDSDATNPLKQYVYHPHYVDAIALRDYDSDTNGSTVRHYYLQDANFNVVAVTGDTGTIVERYSYTPYGEVTFRKPDFEARGTQVSNIANEYLYTGRRLDAETGLQLNRNRFYHQQMGRWVSRDPIWYEGSPFNLLEYVNGKPTVELDPSGEKFIGPPCARCLQAYQRCTNRDILIYGLCTGTIVSTSALELVGCAALCSWAITTGPGIAACTLACTAGCTTAMLLLTLPHCEEALERSRNRCGNEYNRCAFRFKKDCPNGENWRPD